MTELALFLSAFVSVFALVFQQQNVIHRHFIVGAFTSLVIGAALIYQWRAMPGANISEIAATLLGGPAGFVTSLWLHPRIMRWYKDRHAGGK